MTLLAALSAGLFSYMSLGALVGVTPRFLVRSPSGERPRSDRARDWLHQAGADVTPFQFLGVSIGMAFTVAVLMQALTGVLPLTLVAAGLALWLPRSFYGRRRGKIAEQRINAWPDALRDLIAHLKSSMSVHGALTELGRSGPVALRPYFNRYAGLAATLDQRTALEVVREELADPVSDRVLEIILGGIRTGLGGGDRHPCRPRCRNRRRHRTAGRDPDRGAGGSHRVPQCRGAPVPGADH